MMPRINRRACTRAQQDLCAQLPHYTCPFAGGAYLVTYIKERLAQTWCNLNCWRWDEVCGPKPKNWDRLPAFSSDKHNKHEIISPVMRLIENLIGKKECSRAWWIYELGHTEEEWRQWWARQGDET